MLVRPTDAEHAERADRVASKIQSVVDAVNAIDDAQSVVTTGVIGWLTPDVVLEAIANRFERTGHPRDLTFFFPVGTGDAISIPGMDRVARQGLMRRIIAGSFINPVNPQTGRRPYLMELIHRNEVEAYSWPIGATMHWLREVSRRSPGYLTKIGLGTYIDPRLGGGRFTGRAHADLVQLLEFRGEEYLFYPSWPLDVGVIRASAADADGNLAFDDHPLISAAIAIALAVKACGGTVIAQVDRVVERGSLPSHAMRVPGALVDSVVEAPGEAIGTAVTDASDYLGPTTTVSLSSLPRIQPGASKIVARRVAQEVKKGEVSIFGFGAPSDAVLTMVEDGILTTENLWDYNFTTEHGPFGGVVMSDWQFSANLFARSLLDGAYQFDFINGGGAPFAALAFAEFDAGGRVNVTKFGSANPGAGGFIDIAHNARRLVFAGTLTTGGLDVVADGNLVIRSEGRARKLVREVEHITYDATRGVRERGQEVRLITERAVFELTNDGLLLTEVAPGIDIEGGVLNQVGFDVQVARKVVPMDRRLFRD